MRIMVINLDRCPERFTKFSTVNGFLRQVARFPAVEGRAVDRDKLQSDRLLDAALTCSDGALGCALSHIMIWHRVMTDGIATTVCEDDAILNHGFERVSERLVADLPAGWDFILWGWNFDAMLLVNLLPGVSPAAIHCNQDSMRTRLSRFQTLDLEPRALRLLSSCGTLCYSISAGGARKLYAGCTPLKPLAATDAAGMPCGITPYGIDHAMTQLYPRINAFVAVPPLAVSPNEQAASTVQKQATFSAE